MAQDQVEGGASDISYNSIDDSDTKPEASEEEIATTATYAIGAGVLEADEVKAELAEGDKVIYSKYAGTDVKLDDQEYIIVKQNDILAVVE